MGSPWSRVIVFSSWICSSTSASLRIFMVALRVLRGPSALLPSLCWACSAELHALQIVPGILAHCDEGRGSRCPVQGTLEILARPAPTPCSQSALGLSPGCVGLRLLSAQEHCQGGGAFHRAMVIWGGLTVYPTPAPCALPTPSTPPGCPLSLLKLPISALWDLHSLTPPQAQTLHPGRPGL